MPCRWMPRSSSCTPTSFAVPAARATAGRRPRVSHRVQKSAERLIRKNHPEHQSGHFFGHGLRRGAEDSCRESLQGRGACQEQHGIQRCREMVHNSQPCDISVNKFAVFGFKLRNSEVPEAGGEGLSVGVRAEFDVLIDHGLAEIDLPFVEADVALAVHLDHMVFSAVLPRSDWPAARRVAGIEMGGH